MDYDVQQFIKENIDLIQSYKWDEVYNKEFPIGFTETLLECGINPLEQGLNYIPDYFLCKCETIKEFTIPDIVTSIGSYAFAMCTNLTSITIPNSVTSIEENAFYGCNKLTSIEIPEGVTSISRNAFIGCNKLTSIEIPNSVTSIETFAFNACDNLTSINYNGTKSEWNSISKDSYWNKYSVISKIICTDGVIEL